MAIKKLCRPWVCIRGVRRGRATPTGELGVSPRCILKSTGQGDGPAPIPSERSGENLIRFLFPRVEGKDEGETQGNTVRGERSRTTTAILSAAKNLTKQDHTGTRNLTCHSRTSTAKDEVKNPLINFSPN